MRQLIDELLYLQKERDNLDSISSAIYTRKFSLERGSSEERGGLTGPLFGQSSVSPLDRVSTNKVMSKQYVLVNKSAEKPFLPSVMTPSNPSTLKRARSEEPVGTKRAKLFDKENIPMLEVVQFDHEEEVEDEEDDDEDDEPPSIVRLLGQPGRPHPTSKQYLVYDQAVPNMISLTARVWCLKYLKVLAHVNPDAYGMYIHNDFACYGALEVIENSLLDLVKLIPTQPKTVLAIPRAVQLFRRWEAFILVLDEASDFVGIDDGDRFGKMVRLVGACSVTVLRHLLPKSMFDPLDNAPLNAEDTDRLKKISERLLNFQQVLEKALCVGHLLINIGNIPSAYTNILQTVYCNWRWVNEKVHLDLSQQPVNIDQGLWLALVQGQTIKKTRYHESFQFHKELHRYRENFPSLGGNAHDLRKWSRVRRAIYAFGNEEDDDDDEANFWLRM